MKISLALGPPRPLSRQTAWGCLTTNLALPGSGSLVAGRASGYAQLALGVGGMVLTMVFGLRFIYWFVANWTRLHDPDIDPMTALGEMWLVLRWAVLALGIFFAGWLWALVTSLLVVISARKSEAAATPPQLDRDQAL